MSTGHRAEGRAGCQPRHPGIQGNVVGVGGGHTYSFLLNKICAEPQSSPVGFARTRSLERAPPWLWPSHPSLVSRTRGGPGPQGLRKPRLLLAVPSRHPDLELCRAHWSSYNCEYGVGRAQNLRFPGTWAVGVPSEHYLKGVLGLAGPPASLSSPWGRRAGLTVTRPRRQALRCRVSVHVACEPAQVQPGGSRSQASRHQASPGRGVKCSAVFGVGRSV